MTRDEIFTIVAKIAEAYDAYIFAGNGYNARTMCALANRDNNFYMLGSMSLNPTIAAGFSHFSKKPTIVVEGDGNALMGLSGYPIVPHVAHAPFVHILLDNGLYETTGGQKTLSYCVNFLQAAQGAGYTHVYHIQEISELQTVIENVFTNKVVAFIYIKTQKSPIHKRVPYHPREIKERFLKYRSHKK